MNQECRLCGSGNIEVIFKSSCTDKAGIRNEGFVPTACDFGVFYDLAKCADCNAVFALTQELDSDIERLYCEAKDSLYLSQIEERSKTFKKIVSHLKNLLPENARILDVGCSYGLFLKLASRAGMEAYGVELNNEAVRYAREILGLNVLCSDLKEADFPDGYFDVITAIELIEHVCDLKDLINNLYRLLKPQGKLYLVTPDISSLSARLLGYGWWSYRRMHLNYFSKESLSDFLNRNGFSTLSAEPFRKNFKAGYILDNLAGIQKAKLLYRFLLCLSRIFRLENLIVTSSFGDIAVTAKKK